MAVPTSALIVKKKKEAGIIFFSYIPPKMTVKQLREIMNTYGKTNNIFLQPDKARKSGKRSKRFVEGWVEFTNKKVAKKVAAALNGQQVGGKRKCPWYDSLWSMKYLHRFKWTHLNEKLAYEKAVQDQRMRTEIAQAKRESSFYAKSVDRSKALERLAKKRKKEEPNPKQDGTECVRLNVYRQRCTNEEIVEAQQKRHDETKNLDVSLLKEIFCNKP